MTSLVDVTRENYDAYLNSILEIEGISFPSPWSAWAFLQEIKNPVSRLWALSADEGTSGYICFWMFDCEIQLINIAVHPDKRGRGLGLFLMTKMIETGIAKGMRDVWLEVRPSNLTALGLYQKLGFKGVGRRPRYYRETNEDALIMSLALPEGVHRSRLSN